MESRAHALIAGLFVLLFAGAALFSLWWFGGQREDLREVTLVSHQAVNGLNPQATVRYRGVRVGKVKDIKFDPQQQNDILIRLAIDDDTPLTDKTVARLAYQGVTGTSFVQLDDGGGVGKALEGDSPRILLQPSLVSEGIDSGMETLRQVKELTRRINSVLDDDNRQRIGRSLQNIEQLTGHAAKAGERLPEVLNRLNRLASDENLARFAATLRHTSETSAQAGEALRDARQLAISLRTVADRMESVLAKVDGDALASAPAKVGEMAEQVKQTAASVDRFTRLLEDRPDGLIFGKDKREPGPGEPGFAAGSKQ